mgnify:CR=1 FL=1
MPKSVLSYLLASPTRPLYEYANVGGDFSARIEEREKTTKEILREGERGIDFKIRKPTGTTFTDVRNYVS